MSDTWVRRCQGYVVGWSAGFRAVKQCDKPAVNGRRCERHLDQIPKEWVKNDG